jgi:Protein of unknown function (DUF2690)
MFKRIVAAAVVAIALAVTPGVAHAEPREPTCRGTSCDGVSPTSVDCWRDAVTLEGTRTYYYAYTFVIRYSRTCQAAWARLEGGHYYATLYINSYWSDWTWRRTYSSYATPDVPYTPMVYTGYLYGGGLFTEACLYPACTPAVYSLS